MLRIPIRLVVIGAILILVPLTLSVILAPHGTPAVAGNMVASPQQQTPTPPLHLAGSGGAYTAQANNQGTLADAGPLYGSKDGKTCQGTSGTIAKMIQLDFGWSADYLQNKYQKDTKTVLCNDTWPWQSTMNLHVVDVLKALGWPTDLLKAPYNTQVIAVRPLPSVDPTTNTQSWKAYDQQFQSTGPCDWVPNLVIARPHIDICAPFRGLLTQAEQSLKSVYDGALNQTNSFLWTTPTDPFTTDGSGLLDVWKGSWIVVTTLLVCVIAWASIRSMFGQTIHWLTYANAVEFLPRIVFALIAAYFSKEIFVILFQFSNALTHPFTTDTVKTLIDGQPNNTVAMVMQVVYAIMGFLLIVEEAARMAVLYLLFAFSPILFFLAALTETQSVAMSTFKAAILFALLQPAQAATLNVGSRVLSTVLTQHAGNLGVLNFLVAIAIMYICLMLFFSFNSLAFGRAGGPLGMAALGTSLGLAAGGAKVALSTAGKGAGVAGKAGRALDARVGVKHAPIPGSAWVTSNALSTATGVVDASVAAGGFMAQGSHLLVNAGMHAMKSPSMKHIGSAAGRAFGFQKTPPAKPKP